MAIQLEFTQKEQTLISESVKDVGSILVKKMDEGVVEPTLQGTISVKGENKEVVFQVIARHKT